VTVGVFRLRSHTLPKKRGVLSSPAISDAEAFSALTMDRLPHTMKPPPRSDAPAEWPYAVLGRMQDYRETKALLSVIATRAAIEACLSRLAKLTRLRSALLQR